jgi:hypothetical protein
VVALAIAAGGWALGVGPAGPPARVLAALAGCALLWITPVATLIGMILLAAALGAAFVRRPSPTPRPAP